MPPTRFYAGLAGRFVRGFVSNLLRFLPGRGPPTWLRRPGVPFRVWFCEQSSAFSPRRGGHQLGYAGLASRFVTGFVSNLLRFLPDGGGPPTWLRRPGVPFRVWCCGLSLTFSSRRGARQLGYAGQAGRFGSGFVSNLFSCGVVPGAFLVRQGTRDYVHRGRKTRCTGDAGLGALGAR